MIFQLLCALLEVQCPTSLECLLYTQPCGAGGRWGPWSLPSLNEGSQYHQAGVSCLWEWAQPESPRTALPGSGVPDKNHEGGAEGDGGHVDIPLPLQNCRNKLAVSLPFL